jgi:hypothetical protein
MDGAPAARVVGRKSGRDMLSRKPGSLTCAVIQNKSRTCLGETRHFRHLAGSHEFLREGFLIAV